MTSRVWNSRVCRFERSGVWTRIALLVLLAMIWGGVGPLDAAEREPGLRPLRLPVAPLPADYRAVFSAATATDPVGDTTPGATADITRLTAEFFGGVLEVKVEFNGPIATPGSGASNAIDAFVDIDADQDGNTGMPSWTDTLRGTDPAQGTGLGIEYYVDLLRFDPGDGTADLWDDQAGVVVARIPVIFSTSSFTARVPLALIGGSGEVNVAAVVYQTSPSNVFDAVPDTGFVVATEGEGGDGSPGISIDTGDTSPCDPEDVNALCLDEGRFEVTVDWATGDGGSGMGFSGDLTDDTGYFWFFDPDNVEMVIKVLDACGLPAEVSGGHFWVFAGGLTNVEVDILVRDTENGQGRLYQNLQRTAFQPIQDTQAFATCP